MTPTTPQDSGRQWPIGIALGLFLVVAVNATFAWIALRTAPEISPSYTNASQR